jgi:tRNA-dihydrouridine synthase B
LANPVLLAPMSGVTDAPFRELAQRHGAGLVVSEMVASSELLKQRPDMVRRARRATLGQPFVIQLAGREARWMSEGARMAEQMGADIIDINMGCPAREVTGGLSGSALMRDLDHAVTLIAATVAAVRVPVTLKMRLGWDERTMNAAELALRAEATGVQMITVHGRTRCQFYGGRADWSAIRAVRRATGLPLIANGDCQSAGDARAMMDASGADGVMIGRGAYGRPWWPGVVAHQLDPETGRAEPALDEEYEIVGEHHQLTLDAYGPSLGNKTFRKHLGWTLQRMAERHVLAAADLATWRTRLLTCADNDAVADGLAEIYGGACARREAA